MSFGPDSIEYVISMKGGCNAISIILFICWSEFILS